MGKRIFLEYLLIIGYISLLKRGIHNPYLYVNSSQMKIIRRVSHRSSWTKSCIWTKKEHIHIMHYPWRYIILIKYDLSEPFLTNFLFWPRSDLGYTSRDLHIWCTCYINVGVNKSFLCNFHLCRRHNGCFTSTTKVYVLRTIFMSNLGIFFPMNRKWSWKYQKCKSCSIISIEGQNTLNFRSIFSYFEGPGWNKKGNLFFCWFATWPFIF